MAHHQNQNQDGEIHLGAAQEGNGLLNTIENNKYHGLAAEDPYDHLYKINGVSEDAFKLKLFPFSFGDKAHQWERTLPSDSINTWDDCKRAFLEKFFSTSRTAKLRNEISSFHQKNLESFSEAWERFNDYQAKCPHHGFTKENLLSTFYRGALPEYRARLDTASNGFFLGRSEEEAEALVENMVKSDSVYSGEHDRANRGDDPQLRKDMKSLQEKMDILISEKAKQEQMNFVGNPHQETPHVVNEVDGLEGQEELCFINNNGDYQPRNNQQGSHQPQQNPPPGFSNKGNQSTQAQGSSSQHQAQDTSVELMFKQLLEAQSRKVDEIEKLVFGTELGKVEKLVVATAEAQMVDKAMEMVHVQAERKVKTTNLQRAEPRIEKPVERRADQKLKEVKQEDIEVELSPYDKVPFPQRVLTKAQKKVLSKFRKDLCDVGVRLLEISGMREAHVQMMLIKDILDHQEEVAELLDISILKIDPPVPPKSLPKLEDEGKFTLPCSLGEFTLDDALVDSGASVNVISLEMVKSLGVQNMETNTSSLMFGDSSSTTPIGLIKDFPLKIGACTIPIDLTVLDMMTKRRVPLILGTPFLATVGACIDFPNKRVILQNVNKAVSYPIQSPMRNVEYCGTITCGEPSIEKIKDEVVVSGKEGFDGESSKEMCDEHLERAKMEEVCRAIKATHDKKKMMKETHPPPLDMMPHTLTLHPMKLKDGAIEYKIKCKGKSTPFSSAKAIITPQFQDDPIKLQELLSQVEYSTRGEKKDGEAHKSYGRHPVAVSSSRYESCQLLAEALDTHCHTPIST
ncbi:uncharacterized protein LOC130498009 [Raphanus sativus]|uniref:Uncharacterized protein LOC130498009 n=1 Tax=Raphanus sativus TaxID=3726 RepID=A0A9W3C7E8_RAPSA|nr:uncharacterized protein LOC130498009 [Raphanus sativus]